MAKKRLTYGTSAAQEQSKLLTLTPELRNRIYHFVFSLNDNDEPVSIATRPKWYLSTRPSSVLALLQTCRQVIHEAEGLFYFLNHILLAILCRDFLAFLPAQRAVHIRTLSISVFLPETIVYTVKALRHAHSLRALTFKVYLQHLTTLEEVFKQEWYFLRKVLKNLRHVDEVKFEFSDPYGVRSLFPEVEAGWKRWEEQFQVALTKTKTNSAV